MSMQRQWISLILLALFLLEGTVLKWIIPGVWQTNVYVVTHFVLIVIIFVGLYVSRHYALVYGVVFGLIQDIVYYEHALGVYSFSMGLTGYLTGLMARWIPYHMLYSLVMIAYGNIIYEMLIYGLHRYLLKVISVDLGWTFIYKMLPSLIINLLFAVIIYIPVRKLLEQIAIERKTEETID